MRPRYGFQLLLNVPDIMIFEVNHFDLEYSFILFEDARRKGELFRDFEYLYPHYYESESEFKDERNLIKAFIFTNKKMNGDSYSNDIKDDLIYLADNMVEHRDGIQTRIELIYDEEIIKNFDKIHHEKPKTKQTFFKSFEKYCEHPQKLLLAEHSFLKPHLFQG